MSYGRGFEGSRLAATKNMSRAEIAKLYRQDIKDAIKRGDLPKGLKVSVRTSEYAGGGSINTGVTEVPAGFKLLSEQRLYTDLTEKGYNSSPDPYHTPEAAALLKKLDALLQSYNFDDSDSMTDYFHVRFYGDAKFESDLESAERAAYKAAFEAGTAQRPPYQSFLDHREQVEKLSEFTEDPENEEKVAAMAAAKALGANLMAAPPVLTKADLVGLVTGPNPRVVATYFSPPRLYKDMTYEEQGKIDAEEDARERKKAAFMDNAGSPEPTHEECMEAAGWI
jgi:hypothetical protein